jgi:hypothetical protein
MALTQASPSHDTSTADTNLLQLDEVCLQTVLHYLSAADRRRFSRTCRLVRQSWRASVQAAVMSQEDLELHNDQPLCAFPHLKQLQLNSIDLDQDCSSFLQDCAVLQQLESLQLNSPQQLQLHALSGMLVSCSVLTSLQINGGWRCGEGEAAVELSRQRPEHLQQLHLLRNASISPSELRSWLSATTTAAAANKPCNASADPDCGGLYNSSYRRCHANSTGTNSSSNSRGAKHGMQQQLLRLLSQETAADDATTAAPVHEELALLQPAWPHLQELDLSGEQVHTVSPVMPLTLLLYVVDAFSAHEQWWTSACASAARGCRGLLLLSWCCLYSTRA